MRFKPKPFWVRWITKDYQWLTFYPNVYVPEGAFPLEQYPGLIAHEQVHLVQQRAYGKWSWLLAYFANRHFMLSQEAEAIAAEILANPAGHRARLLRDYCLMLSTKDGTYETPWGGVCAETYNEAENAILLALSQLPGGSAVAQTVFQEIPK